MFDHPPRTIFGPETIPQLNEIITALETDKNVCGIVLELPNSALGTSKVGLWARTLDKTGEGWVQADSGGRPLQAVFLPGEGRAAYLTGGPADDDRFIGVFAHELEHRGGYTPQDAKAVARRLLPDIL